MLPIKRIILYKHGVGYFERQGEVENDAQIELQFKAAEMNDVLKSLTVLDLGQGLISSISYDSTRPLQQQLEDIAIRLADGSALTSLLSQIKGARVRLEVGSRQIEGVVAGIQTDRRIDGDRLIDTHRLLLLVHTTGLETFDLTEVKGIELLEESLQKDLQHLLEILFSATKKDLKRLTIFARGQGTRDIMVGYTVESPVWKTSYRVLLDEASALLQGWALVDNTQEEDWDEVSLSLVAGLPISFVHDLYSPRYKRRPVVRVQEEEAYAPPVLEEAMAFGASLQMEEALPPPGAYAAVAGGPMMARRMAARESSVQVQTRTVEVGDLFQYDIKNPVTVKRTQSALVPILQEKFEGKRVAVYNASIRDKNPMSALLFKNSTGLMLEGGPMTVYEKEIYVGEAMLDTMKPAEEKLVPYSVELGCVVGVENDIKDDTVSSVRIAHGNLYFESYRILTKTYLLHNKSVRPIDLFLEHPITAEYSLVDTPPPVEVTPNFYRFRLDVPASQTTRFPMREKGMLQERIMLRTLDVKTFRGWVSARRIPPGAVKSLEELVAVNDGLAKLTLLLKRRGDDIRAIEENQARLRQNLQALGTTQDEKSLRERYVKDLTTDEDTLRTYRDEIKHARDEERRLDEELSRLLTTLHI